MDERVFGPVHGRYITSFAARMGDLGQRYVGYWKVCDQRPADYFGAFAACSGNSSESFPSALQAMLAAEELALAQLHEMPEGDCRPDPDEPLWSVLYVSSQVGPLSAEALTRLLHTVRERNPRWHVTGVLLAFNGRFMQYLEGPRTQLEWIYRIVQTAPLHEGLTELLRAPIERREFADWSMAFGCPEMSAHDPRRTLGALFTGDGVPRTLLRSFLERNA
jgi:hypothetical protein